MNSQITTDAPNLFASEPEQSDVAYTNLRSPSCEGAVVARNYCDDLWRDYHSLANKNFLGQFLKQFHQCWFEMYLATALLRANLPVNCPSSGPDIRIGNDQAPIWIEAIAGTNGQASSADYIPEPELVKAESVKPEIELRMGYVPKEKVILRICNAFVTKSKQGLDWIEKGIIGRHAPFVIAINVREIRHAWGDAYEYAAGALYGLGDRYAVLHRETAELIEQGFQHRPTIRKASQAEVDARVFLSGSHAHVSGVLISTADVANHPVREGDDFLYLPNPFATNPTPDGFIPRGTEYRLRPLAHDEWEPMEINHVRALVIDANQHTRPGVPK